MQDVDVEFESETLSALDEYALGRCDGDRDEAVEALLGEWLARREDDAA
ncbi:MAG: hypothetical protein ABEJ57_06435 [Halobacteriaceae archaeon]